MTTYHEIFDEYWGFDNLRYSYSSTITDYYYR